MATWLDMGTTPRTEGALSSPVEGTELAGEVDVLLDDEGKRRHVRARLREKGIWAWCMRGERAPGSVCC